MIEYTIPGTHEKPIRIDVEVAETSKGVVFIAHGFAGWKTQPYILAIHRAFHDNGYTTVRWDASEREPRRVTTSGYYSDLKIVLKWACRQSWGEQPYVLAGHSLGGLIVGMYAQHHPGSVRALVLAAPALGKPSMDIALHSKEFKRWLQQKAAPVKLPIPILKVMARGFAHDLRQYDLMTEIESLTMPTLVIGGEIDVVTPASQHETLYKSIPAAIKELHVVPNLSHDVHPYDLQLTVREIIARFIKRIDHS